MFEPFRTPSGSMLPTLHESDEFFASKLAYRKARPQRGDLIVFRTAEGVTYIKRVIGLPGDIVTYDGSSKLLEINGDGAELQRLGEYPADSTFDLFRETIGGESRLLVHIRSVPPSRSGRYEVPDDAYFVLGDNRDNSKDSRYADFGFVSAENVVGKVTYVWWNTTEPKRAGTFLE
jgi:signal peptidase I